MQKILSWKIIAVLWLLAGTIHSLQTDFYHRLTNIIQFSPDHLFAIFSFMDSLFLIACVLAILFLFLLFLGKPDLTGRLSFSGRPYAPVLLGVLSASATTLLLLAAPIIPFLVHHGFSADSLPYYLPHRLYLLEAMKFGFCLGYYFFLLSTSDRWARIGSFPFLLVIIPPFNQFPLLWFAAFTRWIPSRAWKPFRPLLAAMSFFLPIIAFFHDQPFYSCRHLPYPVHAQVQILKDCNSYVILPTPGKEEILIKCLDGVSRFTLEHGTWQLQAQGPSPYPWNDLAVDRQGERVWIPDCVSNGRPPTMQSYRWPDLDWEGDTELMDAFPVRDESTLVAIDQKLRILAIMGRYGLLSTFQAETMTPIHSRLDWVNGNGVIRMFLDETRHELIVLYSRQLTIFSIRDLARVKSVELPDPTSDMLLDPAGNRIFVAFPQTGRIGLFDRDSLRLTQTLDAPLVARPLALDDRHRLLFIGSMTGVIRIVDADTFEPIGRRRLSPWLRRMAVFPDSGILIAVFHGEHEVVSWNYLTDPTPLDPLGAVYQHFEKVLRAFLRRQSDRNRNSMTEFSVHIDPRGPLGIHVLLIESDPLNRKMGKAMLQWTGMEATVVESFAKARDFLSNNSGRVDIIILDGDESSPASLSERKAWLKSHAPQAVTLLSTADRSGPCDECIRKPFEITHVLEQIEHSFPFLQKLKTNQE